ncbi:MAG: hypothetical protein AB2728_10890 [Candidatus Thiodiazotropha sp.]
MKHLLGFVLVILMSISTFAGAAPFRYTFSGNVTNISDGAGAAATAGITTGGAISYTFLVDRDQPGTYTRNNGSTFILTDTLNTDFFYDDLLSGSVIDEVNGGFFTSPTSIAEYNRGYNSLNTNYSQLLGGSNNNFVQITSSLDFDLWGVGQYVQGMEAAWSNSGAITIVNSNLRLSSITPVPIPAAAWLFATGLLGLLGFNYRNNKT